MSERSHQKILRDIAKDMKADATRFNGQPFNGRTVAEYLGCQGAAIAAIARIVESILDDAEIESPDGGSAPFADLPESVIRSRALNRWRKTDV